MIIVSIRERILTIRLLEKIAKDPDFAQAIGIENVKEIGDFYRRNTSHLSQSEKV